MDFRFADLFAGIGGFRLGLEKLDWQCAYSCEIDPKCRLTYEANFGDKVDFLNVYEIKTGDVTNVDVICAGFPCQPFSIAGKRNGFSDERGNVFFKLMDVIKDAKPKVVFLENVPNLVRHDKGFTFGYMTHLIADAKYTSFYEILDSADFGVPQHRRRLYVVAFKEGLGIKDFNFTKKRTEQQPFRRFIKKGDRSIRISEKWQRYIDLYTGQIGLSDIPFKIPKTRVKLERKDPDVDLNDCIFQMRSSGIRALSIDKPLPTLAVSVSGGGAMIPVYSRERRHLSLVEMKRLMGFPDNYKFPVARTYAVKQLANAVCPQVIESIGSDIEQALD
jgi:DNA (cytosine-5)-methyltransferase 1